MGGRLGHDGGRQARQGPCGGLVPREDRLGGPVCPPLITASVGIGTPNNADDVSTVQELLNVVDDQGGPDPPLTVDGLIGPNTIKAINKFQMTQLGFPTSGLVPGKDTIKRLNRVLSRRR